MFISHHRSLVHHTPGSHCNTHQDPSKPEPVSKSFQTTRLVSNKFASQPGTGTRTGTGKLTTHSTTTTAASNTSFALPTRPFPHVSNTPAASTQARFGSQQLDSSVFNRSAFAATGNSSSATTGTINRNTPVKFLFKKPPLPPAISSSSALYHFSASQSNSLSKFSIPKLNANAAQNGDHSSLSGGGKSVPSAPSVLDQSGNRVNLASTVTTSSSRQDTGGSAHQPHFNFTKHHYVRVCALSCDLVASVPIVDPFDTRPD